METQRYLLAFLLKPADGLDRSKGGVSALRITNYYVPCDRGNTTLEDMKLSPTPYCILSVGFSGSRTHFRPHTTQEHLERPQFGGCFVYASDSRFSEAYGDHPIHLHDRFE